MFDNDLHIKRTDYTLSGMSAEAREEFTRHQNTRQAMTNVPAWAYKLKHVVPEFAEAIESAKQSAARLTELKGTVAVLERAVKDAVAANAKADRDAVFAGKDVPKAKPVEPLLEKLDKARRTLPPLEELVAAQYLAAGEIAHAHVDRMADAQEAITEQAREDAYSLLPKMLGALKTFQSEYDLHLKAEATRNGQHRVHESLEGWAFSKRSGSNSATFVESLFYLEQVAKWIGPNKGRNHTHGALFRVPAED